MCRGLLDLCVDLTATRYLTEHMPLDRHMVYILFIRHLFMCRGLSELCVALTAIRYVGDGWQNICHVTGITYITCSLGTLCTSRELSELCVALTATRYVMEHMPLSCSLGIMYVSWAV